MMTIYLSEHRDWLDYAYPIGVSDSIEITHKQIEAYFGGHKIEIVETNIEKYFTHLVVRPEGGELNHVFIYNLELNEVK